MNSCVCVCVVVVCAFKYFNPFLVFSCVHFSVNSLPHFRGIEAGMRRRFLSFCCRIAPTLTPHSRGEGEKLNNASVRRVSRFGIDRRYPLRCARQDKKNNIAGLVHAPRTASLGGFTPSTPRPEQFSAQRRALRSHRSLAGQTLRSLPRAGRYLFARRRQP